MFVVHVKPAFRREMTSAPMKYESGVMVDRIGTGLLVRFPSHPCGVWVSEQYLETERTKIIIGTWPERVPKPLDGLVYESLADAQMGISEAGSDDDGLLHFPGDITQHPDNVRIFLDLGQDHFARWTGNTWEIHAVEPPAKPADTSHNITLQFAHERVWRCVLDYMLELHNVTYRKITPTAGPNTGKPVTEVVFRGTEEDIRSIKSFVEGLQHGLRIGRDALDELTN